MRTEEIVLPFTEPETEWVRGRALRKMSPTRNHAEWRFRIALPGEPRRPLVPDVAFVAQEQLRGLSTEDIQAPGFAPAVAVEIFSPGDDPRDVASKVDVYLRAGSSLVIVIDPRLRSITLHDASTSTVLDAKDVLRHDMLPDFELAIESYFAAALDRL